MNIPHYWQEAWGYLYFHCWIPDQDAKIEKKTYGDSLCYSYLCNINEKVSTWVEGGSSMRHISQDFYPGRPQKVSSMNKNHLWIFDFIRKDILLFEAVKLVDFPSINDPFDAMTEDEDNDNDNAHTCKSNLLLVLLAFPTMTDCRSVSILLQSRINFI